jgi:hypothetical protein
VHPLALAASLTLHGAVLVALAVAMPEFGERLESGDVATIDVVMEEEADLPPRLPAEAAPLPERAPTTTPEPSPPAAEPTPEPPGERGPPPSTEASAPEPAAPAAPAPPAADEPPASRETAEARPEPPPAPVEQAPEPAPVAEPPAAEAPAPEETPQAEPGPQIAALDLPPRRRPPQPRREETPAEPAPATPPAETGETAAAEASAGAPQPDPDTRRDEPEDADSVDALLRSVEELARRVEADEAREGTGDADVENPTGQLAALRAQRLGRLIYEQIVGCWNPPAGVEGLREVGPVEIRAEFRQNGEVVSAQVADEDRLATDRVFRSVAESARRAVFNCAPLEGMPAEFYSQWRVVILEFRPDQIAAGG